jgi:soluble lytic murein transglycosylase
MRQESRFDPLARSGAAARGLMQFISSTSDRLATELGRPAPGDEELYDPATSILFGSQYIADLCSQFPDKPEAAAAAYNAGEEAMHRWLARSATNEPAVYVAEIQYAQTKDYVYRVMCNYRMYMLLYDRDLRPARH